MTMAWEVISIDSKIKQQLLKLKKPTDSWNDVLIRLLGGSK